MSEKTHEICEYCGKEMGDSHICSNIVYGGSPGIQIDSVGGSKVEDCHVLNYVQIDADELTRLRAREAVYRTALGYAIPALEWLLERNDIDIDDYEICELHDDLCHREDCNECGCITTKLTLARKALATLDVEEKM